MKRIFSDYAYGPGPRSGCFWDTTCASPERPCLETDERCDVAVIGAGFTGLSAALHLAEQGADVIVVEAEHAGWGASGRNGGFCCLGGGMLSDTDLDRAYGRAARLEWRQAERAAVDLVSCLIDRLGLGVDRHSVGETVLAHRKSDMRRLEHELPKTQENYGVAAELHDVHDLQTRGMSGPFHGGMTIPIGFALNPQKYLVGLLNAALNAGARVFDRSPVVAIDGTTLRCAGVRVTAQRVILATNGYSSEDVPRELAGRYMPAQSNVLVTRRIDDCEYAACGWTADQMAYDSRNLLHYFRRMPDGRFLFGMRGGLLSSPFAERRARAAVVRNFRRLFPGLAHVDVAHSWSGMVCLTERRLPFVGRLDQAGVFAGFAYHGNGVAMGTFAGAILADLAMDRVPDLYPKAIQRRPRRFPLGTWRRALMPPVYACMSAADQLP